MAGFDFRRWPYDPTRIDTQVFREAVEALRSQSLDGIHMVERALGALEIATAMLTSKADQLEWNGESLSKLDHANRDVHRSLEDAMDSVYRAVRAIDAL